MVTKNDYQHIERAWKKEIAALLTKKARRAEHKEDTDFENLIEVELSSLRNRFSSFLVIFG